MKTIGIEQCTAIAKNYPENLTVGNASFNKIAFEGGRMDGYLEDRYLSDKFDVARITRNGNTWMSITPMELESHITHVLEATGNVLVAGLGMGYYITQIVAKPDVKSVVVIEKDPEVIEAYNKLIESNPDYFANGKLHIMQGDFFDLTLYLKENFTFDYAYLDIWLSMDFDQISEDFEKLNDLGGITSKKIGFWGMEKFVYEHIVKLQWHYKPLEMSELIKDEICSEFGEVMEWCYKPSIELILLLGAGE